ncbi:metallopeptidase family protein [bacterium]|nr:metallopeptidase family protein [bacterium]
MDRDNFEKLVNKAILDLPEKVRNLLENVEIVIEDYPSEYQLKKLNKTSRYCLLGLYEGVPKTKRGAHYANVLPDKITIFQKNIERIAKSDKEIKKLVQKTVWHEIAHHFGFNEQQVRELEKNW